MLSLLEMKLVEKRKKLKNSDYYKAAVTRKNVNYPYEVVVKSSNTVRLGVLLRTR